MTKKRPKNDVLKISKNVIKMIKKNPQLTKKHRFLVKKTPKKHPFYMDIYGLTPPKNTVLFSSGLYMDFSPEC